MDNKDLYRAPDVNVASENIQSIGGWLRFFQVLLIIRIVSYSLVLIVFGILLIENAPISEWRDSIAIALESLPHLIFSILIIRIINTRQPHIPDEITKNLKYVVYTTILVTLPLYIAYSNEYITEKPTTFWVDVIFFLIWRSYFRRSKRVKSFYGANAS